MTYRKQTVSKQKEVIAGKGFRRIGHTFVIRMSPYLLDGLALVKLAQTDSIAIRKVRVAETERTRDSRNSRDAPPDSLVGRGDAGNWLLWLSRTRNDPWLITVSVSQLYVLFS